MIFTAPAASPQELSDRLRESFERVRDETGRAPEVRLVALLFAPADAPLSQEQVLPRLAQYHWRSGLAMDVFCAGYTGPPGLAKLDETFRPVAPHAPGGEWHYSDRAFDDMRRFVEEQSSWRYSGEVDLLLVPARHDSEHFHVELRFDEAIELDLARAIAHGAVASLSVFLESLFRYAEANPDKPSAVAFAARQAGKSVAKALLDIVLEALPVDVRPLWRKGGHLRPVGG